MKLNSPISKTVLAAVLAVSVQSVATLPASAGHNSVPANIVGAPASDPANIRKFPATSSAVVATQVNGDFIDLTGRCKNNKTNAAFFIDTTKGPNWNYTKMSKPNMWCQLSMFNQHFWIKGSLVKIQ